MSLPDSEHSSDTAPPSRLARIPHVLGALALTGALAIDAIAVAGRHLGIGLLGAIELVQACIVVAATSAIVLATISGSHARVQILLEKLSPAVARRFDRGAQLVSALALAWLVFGSAWLLFELWDSSEMTELLGIPLRWIRLVWIGGAALSALIFLGQALGRGPRR